MGAAIIAVALGAVPEPAVLRGILAMGVLVSPDPAAAQMAVEVGVEAVVMVAIPVEQRLKAAVVVVALAFLDRALVELRAEQILAGRAEAEVLLVQVGVVLTAEMEEIMAAVAGGCLLGPATPGGARQAQEAVARFASFGPATLDSSRQLVQVIFNQEQI